MNGISLFLTTFLLVAGTGFFFCGFGLTYAGRIERVLFCVAGAVCCGFAGLLIGGYL